MRNQPLPRAQRAICPRHTCQDASQGQHQWVEGRFRTTAGGDPRGRHNQPGTARNQSDQTNPRQPKDQTHRTSQSTTTHSQNPASQARPIRPHRPEPAQLNAYTSDSTHAVAGRHNSTPRAAPDRPSPSTAADQPPAPGHTHALGSTRRCTARWAAPGPSRWVIPPRCSSLVDTSIKGVALCDRCVNPEDDCRHLMLLWPSLRCYARPPSVFVRRAGVDLSVGLHGHRELRPPTDSHQPHTVPTGESTVRVTRIGPPPADGGPIFRRNRFQRCDARSSSPPADEPFTGGSSTTSSAGDSPVASAATAASSAPTVSVTAGFR